MWTGNSADFATPLRTGGVRAETGRARAHRVVRAELVGVLSALALALLGVAHIAGSPRAEVLFTDGDSLLFPLISSSLRVGETQQWVLTSPLFLIEALVYLPVGALGLPVRPTLVIDGVVNIVALYAVLRGLAGQLPLQRTGRIVRAVAALGVFTVMMLCESSSSRNALDLASLHLTTAYYAGTVIATIGAVAVAAAALRDETRWLPLIGLLGIMGISVLSNPLFIAWAVVPLAVALCGAALAQRSVRPAAAVMFVLAAGSGLGTVGRIPFRSLLVQDSLSKVQPGFASQSAQYFAGLLHDRVGTVAGVLELTMIAALLVIAFAATWSAIRSEQPVRALISGVAIAGPVLSAAGSIALGTFAARYMEPVVFLSPLALLVGLRRPSRPGTLGSQRRPRTGPLPLVGIGLVLVLVTTTCGAALIQNIARPQPALDCATNWINAQTGYGAGQYWSIRAVKANLRDPRQLIQTDADGNPYEWLSNISDDQHRFVTWTLSDNQSVPFGPVFASPTSAIQCGRWTITVYAHPLQLGTPHH